MSGLDVMSAEMRRQAKQTNDNVDRIIAEAKGNAKTPEEAQAARDAILAEYAKLAVAWGCKSRKVKRAAKVAPVVRVDASP